MILLVALLLVISALASLALASACLIGQALVESQSVHLEVDTEESFALSGLNWQTAAQAAAR